MLRYKLPYSDRFLSVEDLELQTDSIYYSCTYYSIGRIDIQRVRTNKDNVHLHGTTDDIFANTLDGLTIEDLFQISKALSKLAHWAKEMSEKCYQEILESEGCLEFINALTTPENHPFKSDINQFLSARAQLEAKPQNDRVRYSLAKITELLRKLNDPRVLQLSQMIENRDMDLVSIETAIDSIGAKISVIEELAQSPEFQRKH